MLRITSDKTEEKRVVLKLEGRLLSGWTDVLSEECARHGAAGREVVLDLADVVFVDCDGVFLLERLCSEQVSLVRCPAFVRELIDEKCKPNPDGEDDGQA